MQSCNINEVDKSINICLLFLRYCSLQVFANHTIYHKDLDLTKVLPTTNYNTKK